MSIRLRVIPEEIEESKDRQRLIEATVELSEIVKHTKEADIRYAAAVGHNHIMEIMKRKDEKFCGEVIHKKGH